MGRKRTLELVETRGEAELEARSQKGEEKEQPNDNADRKDRIREIRAIRG